jgi:hypothetical protein
MHRQLRLNETLKNYPNLIFLQGFFHDIVPTFQDKTFDVVYIDGGHDYSSIASDIKLSLPKLKTNGILSGHDYNQEYGSGVIEYINKLVKLNNIKNLEIYSDSSWAIVLPDKDLILS